MMPDNIHPIFDQLVQKEERIERDGYNAKVFWLTGLSGSGKSTIAQAVERKLFDKGYHVIVLDGDNIRTGISKNLGFSAEDRKENIRRIAEVAKLFLYNNTIVLASFVSPLQSIRDQAKNIVGGADFYEIHVKASVELCEQRDVKGLYKKARAGEIKNFTGIDAPYEPPSQANLVLDSERESINESMEKLSMFVQNQIKLS